MILAGAVVIVTSLLQPESRNHPELKKLVIGGLCSLVFIVLENLRSLDLVRISFDVEWIGVVILYGTLGYIAVDHFIGVERRLTALQQELATARQIQFSILPRDPPVTPRLAIATRYLPMTEVAGDFFDFAKVDAERCGFLIADVSGHGVPAALVAAMVKVAFQAQACHRETPERVLAGMNEMLGHILNELQQNAKTDTVFVVAAVLFNLVVLGINWGVTHEASGGHNTGQNDFILSLLIFGTVLINIFATRALMAGRSSREKLLLGLKQMYEDNGVAKYYDDDLLGTYQARRQRSQRDRGREVWENLDGIAARPR